MSNPIWKGAYSNLIKCKRNSILNDPWAELHCLLIGEDCITNNNCSTYTQKYAKGLCLIDFLNRESKFRSHFEILILNAPLEIEYKWFKPAIKKSLLDLHKSYYKQYAKCPAYMMLYGRILFRQKNGCFHFFKLLNFSIKRINLWESAAISHDNSLDKEGLQ